MSIAQHELCSNCGCLGGAHFSQCAMVAQPVSQIPLPKPTAYDQMMESMDERIRRVDSLRRDWELESERRIQAAFDSLKRKADRLERAEARLDAALHRIEQLERDYAMLGTALAMRGPCTQPRFEALEREVAKLTAWSRPPEQMCLSCGLGFSTPEHAATHTCSPTMVITGSFVK